MSKFEGVIPAIITPFNKDGSIYIKGIENEIEYLHSYGYNTIFAGGSYGSFPLIPYKDRLEFNIEVINNCKNLGMKSIIHIGSNSTKEAIDLANNAEATGADAISSVVPYYYSNSFYDERTFIEYYKEIINHTSIDLHCYNNPTTTGFNVSIDFFIKLIDIGIKGIKDGSSDPERIKKMLDICNPMKIEYYPSSTSSLIIGFLFGCTSCISGLALSVPDLVMDIYNLMIDRSVYEAIPLYNKVMKIRSLMGVKTGRAIAAYSMMNRNGVDVGTCKSPWIPLTYNDAEILFDRIRKIDKEEF